MVLPTLCGSYPPRAPAMQVASDPARRDLRFDHCFNMLACFTQRSRVRNDAIQRRRLMVSCDICLPPPMRLDYVQHSIE